MRKQLGVLIAVLALATTGTTIAVAAGNELPTGCTASRHRVVGGEKVSVSCRYGAFPPYRYRVVAHCSLNGSAYDEHGQWVEPGLGTSTAKCAGEWSAPATLTGFDVERQLPSTS